VFLVSEKTMGKVWSGKHEVGSGKHEMESGKHEVGSGKHEVGFLFDELNWVRRSDGYPLDSPN
jgi:hypothetical protein